MLFENSVCLGDHTGNLFGMADKYSAYYEHYRGGVDQMHICRHYNRCIPSSLKRQCLFLISLLLFCMPIFFYPASISHSGESNNDQLSSLKTSAQTADNAEELLRELLNIKWVENPEELIQNPDIRVEPFGEGDMCIQNRDDQGYAMRAFFREGDTHITKLFTYAVPSLETSVELVLMGFLKVFVDTEDAAPQTQSQLIDVLKWNGFTVEIAKKGSYRGKFYHQWQNVFNISKGELNGEIYWMKETYKKLIYVKAVLRHSKFKDCDYKQFGYWDHWWSLLDRNKMPGKFIENLEFHSIADIIGLNTWVKLKDMSGSFESTYFPQEKVIPMKILRDGFERVENCEKNPENRPMFLLFQDFIINYMFRCGLNRDISAYETWLKTHGITYKYSELGRSYHYMRTLLERCAHKYPKSIWGQFAFIKLLSMGFDPSGMCHNGTEQWPVVLERGQEFLEKYPESDFVPEVLFFLGKAGETLFSVSLTKNDSYVYYKQHQHKTESARKKALDFYQQFLKTDGDNNKKEHLKYILPRLRAGISTGCQYYYCFYD